MIGIGLTMEGTGQNNMIYEFMLENGWRQQPRNITEWLELFCFIFVPVSFSAVLTVQVIFVMLQLYENNRDG